MDIIESQYVLRSASEAGVSSWVMRRVRQVATSSMACFWYALPISFTNLTNESLSNLGDLPSDLVAEVIGSREGVVR